MTDAPLILHFLLLSLAAWRITRMLILDEVFATARDRIWDRFPPESTKFGYLFTCFWCLGFWVSLILSLIYFVVPVIALGIALVFALSAVVGILQHVMDR